MGIDSRSGGCDTSNACSERGHHSHEPLIPMERPPLPSSPSAVPTPQVQFLAQLSNRAPASNFTGENDYVIISTLLQTPF